jgi:PAS domain S-box-containing protein
MDTPINILIVDDEPKNLTVLETILDDPGYRLVRAESADQALLALVVEEFALLILDIRMPGMTGFELAQMIKERKKTARVPIIFLTAYYNEDQHVLEGYGTGAVDYLHKPVNPAILCSKVAVFAELYRRTREVGMANRALLAEVTERRRAEDRLREREERLHAILNTAADAIITIDDAGIIQSVNPATERIFKYTAAEMIGQNTQFLIPAPFGDFCDGYLANHPKTGVHAVSSIGREAVAQRQDGSNFPVELTVSEVGYLNIFTVILRDITRRKELEREVVEIASLEALGTKPSIESKLVQRIVQTLKCSQTELRAVMRGLLPVAVDAEGLMAALSDLADRIQQEGQATCTFYCPQTITVADNLTATHLYLIAQEAAHNAVKHARPKHIRLSLVSTDFLSLTVQDDGVGKPAQPTENKGSLGLRIMQNRAAIIGAALTVKPAEPTGTVVTCTLMRKEHDTNFDHGGRQNSDRR